jgi:hypothetical protein
MPATIAGLVFTLTIYFIVLNVSIEFVLIYRPHPVFLEIAVTSAVILPRPTSQKHQRSSMTTISDCLYLKTDTLWRFRILSV